MSRRRASTFFGGDCPVSRLRSGLVSARVVRSAGGRTSRPCRRGRGPAAAGVSLCGPRRAQRHRLRRRPCAAGAIGPAQSPSVSRPHAQSADHRQRHSRAQGGLNECLHPWTQPASRSTSGRSSAASSTPTKPRRILPSTPPERILQQKRKYQRRRRLAKARRRGKVRRQSRGSGPKAQQSRWLSSVGILESRRFHDKAGWDSRDGINPPRTDGGCCCGA